MTPSPAAFFSALRWLDGRPLLDTIEHYRRRMFAESLYAFDANGRPIYDRVLSGRAKKNWKSTDLVLASLYRFLAWEAGPAGNDCLVVSNDEGQAGDDLALVKKLIACNSLLDREVKVYAKEIARKDGCGVLRILPGQDAIGSHGKTFLFLGVDEIHGLKNYELLEALTPDPTRRDTLTWLTSYAGINFTSGIPLYDLMELGKSGADPRFYFSWYGGDFTTDPDFAGEEVTPEERANPSMASWDSPNYLEQQRRRLPANRFRRLHLNLPGSPEGAAFSGDHIMRAVVRGRRSLPWDARYRYTAAVDMSGGSSDDACLAIAHVDPDTKKTVLDLVTAQTGRPPFDPRQAVQKFASICRQYNVRRVMGDAYGGMTFRLDFERLGIDYDVIKMPANLAGRQSGKQPSASDYYEALEPRLNAGEVELLDDAVLTEQLLTLVWKGNKITHESGAHDDYAAAAAIALLLAAKPVFRVTAEMLQAARRIPARKGWTPRLGGLDRPAFGGRY
jgi:hypothetical protein